ncbi:thioredoxin family protein [Halovivax sp.]|uniref:TlpA family protein disulfide reductase n=1 Tax=Halovivax sp. TaxID=1935978 RepID=UPI0025BDCED2|nr:TlpA family protein disulfide reductase [Halovivax sp.]
MERRLRDRNRSFAPRRTVLAGVAGGVLAAVPIAGCLTFVDDEDDDPAADEPDDGSAEPPFEVRTIEAPGSEAGAVTIPEPETVTVLNFTRTACPTSEGYLETIADAKRQVDDERVRFRSIVEYGRDPTETDEAFAEWWAEHDGDWTLAIDDDRAVFGYYGVDSTPETAVLDDEGDPRLSGLAASTGDIVRSVREALAAIEEDG